MLVNGAAGGVGTFAVQIAKALGAEVTGVCGPANVKLVHNLGVSAVIDRTHPLSETAQAFEHLETGHARGKVVISI